MTMTQGPFMSPQSENILYELALIHNFTADQMHLPITQSARDLCNSLAEKLLGYPEVSGKDAHDSKVQDPREVKVSDRGDCWRAVRHHDRYTFDPC